MNRNHFSLRTLVVCSLASLLGLQACREENGTTAPVQTVLLDSIRILNTRLDSVSKTNLSGGGEMDYWQEGGVNRRSLKRLGIQDPATFISNDLSKNSTLIPVKPVLGGAMNFSRISLLGDRWAIASFEDGHVGGNLLLKYTLRDSVIRWKVLDVESEEERLP